MIPSDLAFLKCLELPKKTNICQKFSCMNRDSIIGLSIAFLVLVFVMLQQPASTPGILDVTKLKRTPLEAGYGTPLIDGVADDEVWQTSPWLSLDQAWIGKTPTPQDYQGRYKLAWDENNLYVLAEITDDTLIDIHPDGLLKYWDDDCLEIFVDEDATGGNHQYNYNAFAYHIALDGKVVDVAPDSSFHYFNDHCFTRRKTDGHVTVWEVAVKIFDGKDYETDGQNIAKSLKSGKKMGFALAYCDNDHSPERENFMGNVVVEGADKNRGWIDAGIFGLLELK
jgi:hypothetical protein